MSAFLENHQSRDRSDSVGAGNLGILVDVQLCNLDLPLHLSCNLLQGGRNHPTGAAPLRPEVHDDRLARVNNVRLEAHVCGFRRC